MFNKETILAWMCTDSAEVSYRTFSGTSYSGTGTNPSESYQRPTKTRPVTGRSLRILHSLNFMTISDSLRLNQSIVLYLYKHILHWLGSVLPLNEQFVRRDLDIK